MKLVFCKGKLRNALGEDVVASWAETPSGILTLSTESGGGLLHEDAASIVESDRIVTLDLPGLDDDTMKAVIENVLKRGYLDKPGIRGKDEAILFVLVNEVLTELEGLRQEIEGDETA